MPGNTIMELQDGSKNALEPGRSSCDNVESTPSCLGEPPGGTTGDGHEKVSTYIGMKDLAPVVAPLQNPKVGPNDLIQDDDVRCDESKTLSSILESSPTAYVNVNIEEKPTNGLDGINGRDTLDECTNTVDSRNTQCRVSNCSVSTSSAFSPIDPSLLSTEGDPKDSTSTRVDLNGTTVLKNIDTTEMLSGSVQQSVPGAGQRENGASVSDDPVPQPSTETISSSVADCASSALSDKATEALLRQHLADSGVTKYNDPRTSPWTLGYSPLNGRGVFANRDVRAGDFVGIDVPLVLGPRAGSNSQPMCVGCYTGDVSLFACSRGCGLPVCCQQCEASSKHVGECEILTRWRCTTEYSSDWSKDLLRAVSPLRCLALPPQKKSVLLSLMVHHDSQHSFEVDLIKKNVDIPPTPEEENFLRQACCTLDANAYETVAHRPIPLGTVGNRLLNGVNTSLRGLYPLAAMMNHQCTPNTWHGYDVENRMLIRATVDIPKGTEITTSYTPLFWATLARRHYLAFTKHFFCSCPRCHDHLEGGANLGALRCAHDDCPGSILCMNPVSTASRWKCDACGLQMPGRQAAVIQSSLGCLLSSMDCRDPQVIRKFLDKHYDAIPTTNQVAVEMKCNLVWLYGHCKGYLWAELSDNMLDFKERLCRELLGLVQLLGAGQCRMKGLFLYELHCTLLESLSRRGVDLDSQSQSTQETEALAKEVFCTIQEAAAIFKDDITAPPDVWVRLQMARKVMKTTV